MKPILERSPTEIATIKAEDLFAYSEQTMTEEESQYFWDNVDEKQLSLYMAERKRRADRWSAERSLDRVLGKKPNRMTWEEAEAAGRIRFSC